MKERSTRLEGGINATNLTYFWRIYSYGLQYSIGGVFVVVIVGARPRCAQWRATDEFRKKLTRYITPGGVELELKDVIVGARGITEIHPLHCSC